MKKFFAVVLCLALFGAVTLCSCGCSGKAHTVNISADAERVDISSDLYGLFIEDISFACDGGLVSNLIANTGFDYAADPTFNWVFDNVTYSVDGEQNMNANNAHYLRIVANGGGSILNKGYVEYYKYLTWKFADGLSDIPDMGFKKGVNYRFVAYIKNIDFDGTVSVSLSSPGNNAEIALDIPAIGDDWTGATAMLTSAATEDGGLKIAFDGTGTLLFDSFELVPSDSYGYDDPNWKYVSLRADLYDALRELSPAFVRFPGGCLAEGTSLEQLYDWKETIGELNERKHYSNIWNDDANGLAYDNTNAMGYHEYFQLSEDLGALALPILNAGTICQFQMRQDGDNYFDWEKKHQNGKITEAEWQAYLQKFALTPGTAEFDAYVQDILDLIEYANGDTSTTWGAKRAANGHPEPFNLQYIGIGNENWGELYWRNFDAIYSALKERAPEITVISSAGPFFDGKEKDLAWRTIDEKYSETLTDEHYYLDKEKMFKNYDFYDDYPRTRNVFVGEYATTCRLFGKFITKNNLWAAIEEAGYMCGFERNGDIVKMASYAPTFAKINAQRWKVNMIWFDSQHIVLTPNYYVQMLYSNNYGTQYIKTDMDLKGCSSSATVDEDNQVVYYKFVNSTSSRKNIDLNVTGFGDLTSASVQYIANSSKAACNELGSTTVVPLQRNCDISGNTVSFTAEAQSVNVIRVSYGNNTGADLYQLPDIPATMESTVTKYTRPYLTRGGLIAICVGGGSVILACAAMLLLFLFKKLRAKQNRV